MKYYVKMIKPYILHEDSSISEVPGYNWEFEEREEELRNEIFVGENERLFFSEHFIESLMDKEELDNSNEKDDDEDDGYFLGWNACCDKVIEVVQNLTIGD